MGTLIGQGIKAEHQFPCQGFAVEIGIRSQLPDSAGLCIKQKYCPRCDGAKYDLIASRLLGFYRRLVLLCVRRSQRQAERTYCGYATHQSPIGVPRSGLPPIVMEEDKGNKSIVMVVVPSMNCTILAKRTHNIEPC